MHAQQNHGPCQQIGCGFLAGKVKQLALLDRSFPRLRKLKFQRPISLPKSIPFSQDNNTKSNMDESSGATTTIVDELYEFSAPRFFDFIKGELEEETRKAELWFETALTYAPSRMFYFSFSFLFISFILYVKNKSNRITNPHSLKIIILFSVIQSFWFVIFNEFFRVFWFTYLLITTNL